MSYLDRYKSTTAADRPPPPPTPSTNATPPPTPQYGDRRVARAADAARIRAHNRIMRRRLAATKQQAPLARDLGALLPAGPPRIIGDAPTTPGQYRRLAPSGRHDAVRRVKRAVCRSS